MDRALRLVFFKLSDNIKAKILYTVTLYNILDKND